MEAFEELKLTGRLPSPPGVGMAILKLTQGDNFSIDDVAKAIQSDPALTGRLLKLTNSAKNAGVEPITTVEEAVSRLGISALRGLALGFSLISNYREGACSAFDFSRFWSESLARALAAQQVAMTLEIGSPAEAYICGLMLKIGMLGFACAHPQQYEAILRAHFHTDAIRAAELAAFDVHHGDLGKALLLDWGLPEANANVLPFDLKSRQEVESKRTATLVDIMKIAHPIGLAIGAGEEITRDLLERLESAAGASGMKLDDFKKLCDSVADQWQEWGAILKIETHHVPPFEIGAASTPASTTTGSRPVSPNVAVESTSKIRVLLVDEDLLSVRILSKTIDDSDHEVTVCQDGAKALATILESLPDIVICNRELTGTDGIRLIQTLRGCPEGQQVYVVLLDPDGSEKAELAAYEAGVDDFMQKPVHPDLIRARVVAGARLVALKREIQKTSAQLESQVAEMAVLNRRLTKASLTDPLTDLPNRRAAMQSLKDRWAQAHREDGDSRLAVIMMDIDHFKQVNDTFGHDVGDEVLRETAFVFDTQTRAGERVARVGGEEFLLVCGPVMTEQAEEVAERFRAAVEAHNIKFGEFDDHVTVSVGLAFANPKVESIDVVLRNADEALYKAKRSGRNQVCVVRPGALV